MENAFAWVWIDRNGGGLNIWVYANDGHREASRSVGATILRHGDGITSTYDWRKGLTCFTCDDRHAVAIQPLVSGTRDGRAEDIAIGCRSCIHRIHREVHRDHAVAAIDGRKRIKIGPRNRPNIVAARREVGARAGNRTDGCT